VELACFIGDTKTIAVIKPAATGHPAFLAGIKPSVASVSW